jgi:hypothetical protein
MNNMKYTKSGYGFYVMEKDRLIFITKHNVVVATMAKQTLTAEGVEELAEGFCLLYDELLYSKSSLDRRGK